MQAFLHGPNPVNHHVGIDGVDLARDRRRQGGGFQGGADRQKHPGIGLLLIGEVGRDLAVSLQAILFDHAHYTYDRNRLLRIEPQVLSNRIAVGPEAACEFLVDDYHLGLIGGIVFREITALAQRNFHRPKIIGASDAKIDLQFLAGRRSVPFHIDVSPTNLTRERQCRYQAFRHYAGQVGNAAFDFVVEIDEWLLVLVVLILPSSDSHLHSQDAVGGEPRRHALQAHETANQQSGSDQEHQRKSQLGNDQQSPHAVAAYVQTTVGPPAAATSFQRSVHIHFEGAPERCNPEENSGSQRDAKGEHEDSAIDCDGFQARNISRVDGSHRVNTQLSNQQPGSAAQEPQENTFGKKLPGKLLPARA